MLSDVEVVVLPANEDEFSVDKATMQSIGIDVDRTWEQLASRSALEVTTDSFEQLEDSLMVREDDLRNSLVTFVVDGSIKTGFLSDRRKHLERLVLQHNDV
ncbi:hypothetical protein Ae201684P_000330 [Aphanomyces euteiches]|nr:hypothetical protein Ae201684P_000330 [Aphanomyces euteiches]KAH9133179.1 hypothetical protein AeRB84_020684 [Aphanomyces euteiches]